MKHITIDRKSLNRTWDKQFMDESHYDLVLDENIRVDKPDGEPLLVLLKNPLSKDKVSLAWSALKRWNPKTENRSTASGISARPRKKLDGTYSKITRVPKGWEVISGIMGYFERTVRMPYCHPCTWNEKNPSEFAKVLPLAQEVSSLFREHVPKRYAIQKDWADRTAKDFVIPGTVYTTVTVNKNFRTACHQDKGDLDVGFSCMTVFKDGDCQGARLVLPNWRIAVELNHGDTIFFDAHEWHGNTQLLPLSPKAVRCSLVYYYRTKMIHCGSMAEELNFAKNRKPGEPLYADSTDSDSVEG